MFKVDKDDGRCPDTACRRPLTEKDYHIGICPHCDGVLPAATLKAHAEKIEQQGARSGK